MQRWFLFGATIVLSFAAGATLAVAVLNRRYHESATDGPYELSYRTFRELTDPFPGSSQDAPLWQSLCSAGC